MTDEEKAKELERLENAIRIANRSITHAAAAKALNYVNKCLEDIERMSRRNDNFDWDYDRKVFNIYSKCVENMFRKFPELRS